MTGHCINVYWWERLSSCFSNVPRANHTFIKLLWAFIELTPPLPQYQEICMSWINSWWSKC